MIVILTVSWKKHSNYSSSLIPIHPAKKVDSSNHKPLVLAVERLDLYFDSLVGKRVAIVGNQTSLIGKTHLVDTLISLGIKIQKVFAPEHGFRGVADNGEHVWNDRDPKTGVDIISLYGHNRKPTKDQMSDVDIVLFDRSYFFTNSR